MEKEKRKYIYEGTVLVFGTCVATNWHGETYATTPSKAKSNLIYQYKKQNGYSATAKVDLVASNILPEETWKERVS